MPTIIQFLHYLSRDNKICRSTTIYLEIMNYKDLSLSILKRLFNIQNYHYLSRDYILYRSITIYWVTHKGCDFNDDCRAFIQSCFNKALATQQCTDCNHVLNINHKPLQGLY